MALLKAVNSGKVEAVKEILDDENSNVDCRDNHNFTGRFA